MVKIYYICFFLVFCCTKEPKTVLVDILNGGVYQVENFEMAEDDAFFSELPLADYPMAIVENDEIRFQAVK